MSVLLFVFGCLGFAAGAALVGLGYTLELSLGNSLLVAGTTAMTGGLILFGLAAVVSQLQRLREALANGQELGLSRPRDLAELRATPSRVAFPPKPKLEPKPEMPVRPAAAEPTRMTEELPSGGAETDEAPLSPETAPRTPMPSKPVEAVESEGKSASKPTSNGAASVPPWRESVSDLPPWRAPPEQRGFFDNMWNGEPRREAMPPSFGESAPPAPSPPRQEAPEGEAVAQPEPAEAAPETADATVAERRVVAVLKSGVVDGMGYTLYVDGSIEAELPQGTLRFASISELRKHLESSS